jgi:hypothetical protein
MIYQLAKTCVSLSGQVKVNLIMNGDKISDIQYSPVSPYINYNGYYADDTINYSHQDNVKKLYKATSSTFFTPIKNSDLSELALHKTKYLYDDTHCGDYEMSLRRAKYSQYNKQFEFFCPIWCDTYEELKNLQFRFVFTNIENKKIYTKVIDSSLLVSYLKSFYSEAQDNISDADEESEAKSTSLLYLDFDTYTSYCRGLNASTGAIQVVDCSYIIDGLSAIEQPVIETDNMLVGVFEKYKLVATQLLNLNFLFNLEDFVPVFLLKDMYADKINVYIDLYENDILVPVKDIYSNYDFIPKYDNGIATYYSNNVLDYMQDYKATELCTKNRIVQNIFHWSTKNNKNLCFNLYDGFAPAYTNEDETVYCTETSENIPDMYSDVFNIKKNPFGIFNYKDLSSLKITDINELIDYINNSNNYFELDFTSENRYVNLNNIIINNSKLKELLPNYDKKALCINYISISKQFSIELLQSIFKGDIIKLISGYAELVGNDIQLRIEISENDFILHRIIDEKEYITFISYKLNNSSIYNNYTKNIYFAALYKLDYTQLTNIVNDYIENNNNNLYINGNTYTGETKMLENERNNIVNFIKIYTKLSRIMHCAKKPYIITFKKTTIATRENTFSAKTEEVLLNNISTNHQLQRYAGELLPMFIDTDSSIYYNYEYWIKQYSTIENRNKYALDKDVLTFVQYNSTGYLPKYPSIGYYAINKSKIDYNSYYLNNYQLIKELDDIYRYEESWYKNNNLWFLPNILEVEKIIPSEFEITKDYLCELLYEEFSKTNSVSIDRIQDYIYYLYKYSYSYDYVNEKDINNIKIKIKFELK